MWAHSSSGVSGRWHPLGDHLRVVSSLARGFGEAFGAADLCAAIGLLHDAGKADPEWQRKLALVDGSRQAVGVPHKQLGARLVADLAGIAGGMCILGHHGGLGDSGGPLAIVPGERDEVALRALVDEVPEVRALLAEPQVVLPATWDSVLVIEMGLRLAFSALVDADHLDTGAHFTGQARPALRPQADMIGLLKRFEAARERLLADRPASPLDTARQGVYEDAVRAAAGPTGIYRLPAPTGAGKTISAAAFALHHAAHAGKSRVIVAVPFITITQQNATVYRRLLGDDAVLEHHSAVDLDAGDHRQRLGAENWDSPFVITTTVQLFDSLFGRKPGRSRKVHRLANAVVVLDEVQSLPVDLLLPILDGLRTLSERFGTTVLLASATQPSFPALEPWRPVRDRIREVVPDPRGLADRFRRVRYEWLLDDESLDLAAVARRFAEEEQGLAVVNTVADARSLFRSVRALRPDAAVHLSTRMCPKHRRDVLELVTFRLATGEPCLLVSTQLVEAGVDLDFPAVFRALAPAESLLQAGGRCNREHRRAGGRVVIFQATDTPVPQFYRTAVSHTLRWFGPGKAEPDDIDALDRYYRSLYASLNIERTGRGKKIQANREMLDFPAVADGPVRDAGLIAGGGRARSLAFRMLDEDAVPVVVTDYADQARVGQLIADARDPDVPLGPTMRALQPYVVGLPRRIATKPDVRALLVPVVADLHEWTGTYDVGVGIDDADTVTENIW